MTTPRISIWPDPPKMDTGTPDPVTEHADDALWLAYRTHRGDHFAVLRFSGVHDFTLGDPNDERLDTHPLFGAGLQFYAFHEVHDTSVAPGLRRWIVTFHDETLDVTAKSAEILLRAIQAPTTVHALAAVRGPGRAA